MCKRRIVGWIATHDLLSLCASSKHAKLASDKAVVRWTLMSQTSSYIEIVVWCHNI